MKIKKMMTMSEEEWRMREWSSGVRSASCVRVCSCRTRIGTSTVSPSGAPIPFFTEAKSLPAPSPSAFHYSHRSPPTMTCPRLKPAEPPLSPSLHRNLLLPPLWSCRLSSRLSSRTGLHSMDPKEELPPDSTISSFATSPLGVYDPGWDLRIVPLKTVGAPSLPTPTYLTTSSAISRSPPCSASPVASALLSTSTPTSKGNTKAFGNPLGIFAKM